MSSKEDNYLANLTTNGSCFICLQTVDSLYQKELVSLNILVKYLRIEIEDIIGVRDIKVKSNELKVEVCSGCERNLREFSQLYDLLEKTKIKMGYLLTTFQNLIGDSGQYLDLKEEDGTKDFKRMESSLDRLQLVKRVRELIRKKCMEKGGRAQVILQRLPVPRIKQELRAGEDDDPQDSDYIPTSDEESEESQSVPIPSNHQGENTLRALQPRVDLRVSNSKYAKYYTKIKSTDGTKVECKICHKLLSTLGIFGRHLKLHFLKGEDLIPDIPAVPEAPKFEEASTPLVEEIEIIKTEAGSDSVNPTMSENGRFKCTIPGCKKDYKTKALFYWHIRNHKKPKIYIENSKYSDKCREVKTPKGKMVQCKNCRKNFKCMDDLGHHYKEVHAPKKHKCSECGWSFAYKRNLTVHWKRQHAKQVQIEDQKEAKATPKIGTKRKSKYAGKFTEIVISGKEMFECNECKRTCNLLGDFITHFNYVHAPRRFKCNDCGLPFPSKQNLTRHFGRMHSKSKQ